MIDPAIENMAFFVGKQIEHTRAKGHMTLFVVGDQCEEEIEKRLSLINNDPRREKVLHIYFAAKGSFRQFCKYDLLQKYLNRGYIVTLEVPCKDYDNVCQLLPKQMPDDASFNIVLSLPIPLANQQPKGTRVTIKVDDCKEPKSNPGVWCFPLQMILGDYVNNFTSFDDMDSYEPLP